MKKEFCSLVILTILSSLTLCQERFGGRMNLGPARLGHLYIVQFPMDYTFKFPNGLPHNFLFEYSNNTLYGVPVKTGRMSVDTHITNKANNSMNLTYVFQVKGIELVGEAPTVEAKKQFEYEIRTIGGVQEMTYSLVRAPSWVNLEGSKLKGKPPQPGLYQLLIQAKDTIRNTANLSIRINAKSSNLTGPL